MIPDSFIQELKYRCDVESVISSYVQLKRRGRNLTGLCPFHSEKTPSFTVYPDSQSFYCFGCGAGGDVVTFVRRVENLDYVEAIRFLAQKAGLAMPEEVQNDPAARLKTRILELNREAARFFFHQLISPEGRPGYVYLRQRGLTDQTIKRFGLGYAGAGWDNALKFLTGKGYSREELLAAALVTQGRNGSLYDLFRGRVIFPIIDIRGNVIGFGGRLLEGNGPKYLNSPDTPVFKKSRNLFAMNVAKSTKESSLILAEGYMDVVALHQGGFENAVATLGTSLTQEQARIISGYCQQVVISYDSDEAGQKATRRAINLFNETGVKVKVLKIEGAKDPDEYIKKFGAARFKKLLEGSRGAVDFEIEKLKSKYETDTAEGKVAFLKDFASLMAGVNSPIEREVYIGKVCEEFGVSKENMMQQAVAIMKQRIKAKERKERSSLKIYTGEPPGVRTDPQRSKYIRYALAEDKLIGILMKNPDYYEHIHSRISPEDFVTTRNQELFGVLVARLAENKAIDMMSLSALLNEEQMSVLSQLVASVSGMGFQKEDADDYINAILEFKKNKTEQQVAGMDNEQLKDYITSLAAKKK